MKEIHNGPELAFIFDNRRVYAYASDGRISYYQMQGRAGKIGQFKAFFLGLPSVWNHYLLFAVLLLVPVLFLVPVIVRFLRRLSKASSDESNLRLSLYHRCMSVLLAYVMLISPVGFESLAQAATLYSQLETTDWASGNRTIEYTYDDNGSVVEKVTENSITQATLETVTYDYNLQNRLVSVSDGTTTVTYKYNPDGIRVQADDGTTITDYLIDSYNHTGYAQVLEEWSGGTHPDITYTIGDDVITQYSSSPGAEHLLYDGHGSTRQLVDNNEDVTEAFSYDAYGFMLGGNPARGSSPATNLLYAGEQCPRLRLLVRAEPQPSGQNSLRLFQ